MWVIKALRGVLMFILRLFYLPSAIAWVFRQKVVRKTVYAIVIVPTVIIAAAATIMGFIVDWWLWAIDPEDRRTETWAIEAFLFVASLVNELPR